MPATILYRDDDMLEENNDIRGSNRIRYMPWSNRITSAERNHSSGNALKEGSFKEMNYDALQKFPEDQLARILKPAQTEIPTADIVSSEFRFNLTASAVKIIVSNMKNVNTANAKASIINSLLKQWDFECYGGAYGNVGVEKNPKWTEISPAAAVGDIKALIKAISSALANVKDELQITDDNFSEIIIGYTGGISEMMTNIYLESGITGLDSLKKAFPSIEFGEIPKVISNDPTDGTAREFFEIYYKPMITQHHGSIPSQYATEEGEFGLSEKVLFAYESAAFELEEKGCITRQPVTL